MLKKARLPVDPPADPPVPLDESPPPHPARENSVISNRTRVEMENDDLQRMVLSLGNQRAGLYLH